MTITHVSGDAHNQGRRPASEINSIWVKKEPRRKVHGIASSANDKPANSKSRKSKMRPKVSKIKPKLSQDLVYRAYPA
jgi:hypothetical protein